MYYKGSTKDWKQKKFRKKKKVVTVGLRFGNFPLRVCMPSQKRLRRNPSQKLPFLPFLLHNLQSLSVPNGLLELRGREKERESYSFFYHPINLHLSSRSRRRRRSDVIPMISLQPVPAVVYESGSSEVVIFLESFLSGKHQHESFSLWLKHTEHTALHETTRRKGRRQKW